MGDPDFARTIGKLRGLIGFGGLASGGWRWKCGGCNPELLLEPTTGVHRRPRRADPELLHAAASCWRSRLECAAGTATWTSWVVAGQPALPRVAWPGCFADSRPPMPWLGCAAGEASTAEWAQYGPSGGLAQSSREQLMLEVLATLIKEKEGSGGH